MVQVFTERCFRTDCTLNHANAAGLVLIKSKGKKKNPKGSLLFWSCCHTIGFWKFEEKISPLLFLEQIFSNVDKLLEHVKKSQ